MDKCSFCKNGKGTEPITDGETLQEILICKNCDFLLSIVGTTDKQDIREFENPVKIQVKN